MAVRVHSGPIHHGLIVIDVPSSTATHEGWDPSAGPVHAASGSVYVPMIPSVDGPINVSILSQESVDDSRSDLVPVFDGDIGLPNEDLRITDANEVVHIIVPAAERASSRVKLSVDDVVYPSVLEITVG